MKKKNSSVPRDVPRVAMVGADACTMQAPTLPRVEHAGSALRAISSKIEESVSYTLCEFMIGTH